MDLGNMFFTLGLSTKDFDKKFEDERKKAEEFNKDIRTILSDIGRDYQKTANNTATGNNKVADSEERRKQIVQSLTAQINKLAEAENKVKFAQQHSGASGMFTDNAIRNIQKAKDALNQLQQNVSNGGVPRSSIQIGMEQATRSIRESNTAISQQKILNQENTRVTASGKNEILNIQRKINEAQAQNARLISSSNGNLSVTKRLFGEIGSAASMYFSIFTAGSLVSSLIRIRGEFDMQYISLKAILQSGEQATKLFEQLKGLAVVSPFKFMDLTGYAKQLSAYQIPTNELFDTTKRLSDLSSGLGVDFGRIVLAYGQIRSSQFLRGQELRQLTEAGIPMVDELANKFTKLTGTVTSAGDVLDKISKRQVPFQMVKDVITDLTSEGGKFYNMQEKQAESLKGKVSNLADQYDIMMNRIGQSNDGLLKGGVDALNGIMEHSETLLQVLKSLVGVYGLYKVAVWANTATMGSNLA